MKMKMKIEMKIEMKNGKMRDLLLAGRWRNFDRMREMRELTK